MREQGARHRDSPHLMGLHSYFLKLTHEDIEILLKGLSIHTSLDAWESVTIVDTDIDRVYIGI